MSTVTSFQRRSALDETVLDDTVRVESSKPAALSQEISSQVTCHEPKREDPEGRVRRAIEQRLGRQLAQLNIMQIGREIVVIGVARSYHTKQLVNTVALNELGSDEQTSRLLLSNEIRVVSPR